MTIHDFLQLFTLGICFDYLEIPISENSEETIIRHLKKCFHGNSPLLLFETCHDMTTLGEKRKIKDMEQNSTAISISTGTSSYTSQK